MIKRLFSKKKVHTLRVLLSVSTKISLVALIKNATTKILSSIGHSPINTIL